VKKILKAEEVSVGPYILTGGELPALSIIDATARQVPGVLGKIESLEEGRVASHDVYTRPEIFEYKGKKYRVPKVLLSGHHANVDAERSKKRSDPSSQAENSK
jgi:tRNA (guanine37-N1)-methyltransferase